MKYRILFIALVGVLAFQPAHAEKVKDGKDTKNDKKTFTVAKSLNVFNSVVRELKMLYVDDFDYEKSVNTAIDAMLEDLDPYTVYYPADDTEELEMMITGKYAGVGAIIRYQKKREHVVISEPYENMPAYNAGLRAGDVILRVDSMDVKGKDTQAVSNLLRGDAGTTVTVTAQRPDGSEPKTYRITRANIQLPVLPYYDMLDDSTGYILFERFVDNCSRDVRLALVDLVERGAKRLVLDLRSNGGGSLAEAVEIVNLFVPKGETVVETKGRLPQASNTYKTRHAATQPDMPLVVLVNGQTASAAEIVAGALQDLDRAVIVGTRTYGKGLVQVPRDLPYGANLKVTTSKYYIPSGRCIQAIDYAKRDEDGNVGRIPDSLTTVFRTAAGREVRDGCGISPDIEVELEKVPNLLYYLSNDDCLFDFTTQWWLAHDSIPSAYDFEVDDDLYAAFRDSVRASGFTYDRGSEKALKSLKEWAEFEGYMDDAKEEFSALEAKLQHNLDKDFDNFADDIKRLLANEIVTRYYFQRGSIIQTLKDDPDLRSARDVLADPARYRTLLQPK
ncbi:MAG: S41 family peptidase [Bacteroidaceae bacterium]|nr:S41 family peptidase [Bacteroidaceae bacterium]